MIFLRSDEEMSGVQFGAACFLATSQWEIADQEQALPGRKDSVGSVSVEWQGTKPQAKGGEFAYPLMLAAMRSVIRRTRRLPPFVTIIDVSTENEAYIEVARIDDQGITRQAALTTRNPGTLARAIERLTTDDTDPIFYLGSRPFPEGESSRIGELVLPLTNHPVLLEKLLLSGCNPNTKLPLVVLTAQQRTVLLSGIGIILWGWSAFHWLQMQQAFDQYGSGLMQTQIQPLKDQLRSLKVQEASLSKEFAKAKAQHLPSTQVAGVLRKLLGTGIQMQSLKQADRQKLHLSLGGQPTAVLSALGRLSALGAMNDLNFSVRPATATDTEKVSVPIEIELTHQGGKHG
jgi:hypothetical protein